MSELGIKLTNNAFGYAYGLDLRLNGEFVKELNHGSVLDI